MENGVRCPDYLTWLYGGIAFNLSGNGGPECASYLSPIHRVIETAVILAASIIEISLSLKRIKTSDKSCLSPNTLQSSENVGYQQTNGKIPKLHNMQLSERSGTKMFLLVLVTLIFGIEIGYKFCTNTLIYLLNPCHILTVTLIYLLAADERKDSKTIKAVFRVHLHLLSGALLAILLPVVNTRFLSFEKHSYWVHHILIYIIPGYLLTIGGPYTAEPLKDVWWPILSIGCGFFYHFTVLQGLALATLANLNNMLCPALSDPFEGPYYRVWAFGHQHLLVFFHGKLYQLATYAIAQTFRFCVTITRSKIKLVSKKIAVHQNDNNHQPGSSSVLDKQD